MTELPPLTFRAFTLPFAAIGLLLDREVRAAKRSAIPRAWWGRVATLAIFNITAWNGFILFGVQQMPAGRSAILAYTMPVWATLDRAAAAPRAAVAAQGRRASALGMPAWRCCSATISG